MKNHLENKNTNAEKYGMGKNLLFLQNTSFISLIFPKIVKKIIYNISWIFRKTNSSLDKRHRGRLPHMSFGDTATNFRMSRILIFTFI